MENWFNILKTPYLNWKEVQAPFDDDVRAQGTLENPMVFMEDPKPLPNEEWGSDYLKRFAPRGELREKHTYTYSENQEMSSFGRVKIDNKIQMPKLTEYGFGSYLEGKLKHYKKHRYKSKYGGKTQTYERRGSMIPYKITVKWMLKNSIPIPDDAPVFASGTQIGTYGEWKKEYEDE